MRDETIHVEVIDDDKVLVPVGRPLPAVRPQAVGDIELHGTWDRVKVYADHAAKFERAKLACQVLAGFELLELHRTQGVRAGRPAKLPNDSGINPRGAEHWAETCRREAGISDDTARNWMRMADAVKPRLRKLPGLGALVREILTRPLAELTEAQHALLDQAVHKVADGKTQLEFMIELGLAKQPPGGPENRHLGGRGKSAPATEEQLRELARADADSAVRALLSLGVSFTLLDDNELAVLIAELERRAAAMRKWYDAPDKHRGPALQDELRRGLAA